LNDQDFITIARIVKPQGRRGEVMAEILTDFPERFAAREQLVLANEAKAVRREVKLESSWLHKGRVVLKFRGVDSIEEAESLAGCEVQIPKSERVELEAGSFFVGDLVGCSLWDHSSKPPREIGAVESVAQGTGSAPLLNVRRGSEEIQIPFAQEYIVSVDTGAKRIDLKLPAGLLEINEPLTEEEKQRFKRKQQDEV
jgi:16S rRNA processing protein RimM